MIEKDKRAAVTINGQNDSENKKFIFFELANSLMCFMLWMWILLTQMNEANATSEKWLCKNKAKEALA